MLEVDVTVEVEKGDVWAAGGLRPPVPSSLEPNGIPLAPTGAVVIPVGDELDTAGCANEGELPPGQVPDAAVPPPSKTVIDVVEPGKPKAGFELEQPDVTPNAGVDMPAVVISVAPNGIPVGATGEPGPMPSGVVEPIPPVVPVPETCAALE